MEFNNALFFLKQGRAISRKSWKDKHSLKLLSIIDGDFVKQSIYNMDGEKVLEEKTFHADEILASDWILI